jgi:hypothetical protein
MQGMATSRHYSRSPISEAIIDFQVELPNDVARADLLLKAGESPAPGLRPETGPRGSEDMETKFRALVKRWKKETAHLSSAARMARHPAYQEIIDMGQPVVPLLLAELRRKPNFWFAALRAITGENPVPPESAGSIEMARAWVEWGRSKGHIE